MNEENLKPLISIEQQLEDIYPKELTIVVPINAGMTIVDNKFVTSSKAIEIKVTIDDSRYSKSEVIEAIEIGLKKIREYFK